MDELRLSFSPDLSIPLLPPTPATALPTRPFLVRRPIPAPWPDYVQGPQFPPPIPFFLPPFEGRRSDPASLPTPLLTDTAPPQFPKATAGPAHLGDQTPASASTDWAESPADHLSAERRVSA